MYTLTKIKITKRFVIIKNDYTCINKCMLVISGALVWAKRVQQSTIYAAKKFWC